MKNPLFHVEQSVCETFRRKIHGFTWNTCGISPQLRLISISHLRAFVWSRLALRCFMWNVLFQNSAAECSIRKLNNAADTYLFVSREGLMEGKSRRHSRLCRNCRSADISFFFRSDQQVSPQRLRYRDRLSPFPIRRFSHFIQVSAAYPEYHVARRHSI